MGVTHASRRVVRLIRTHAVAEFLGEQVGKIWTADLPGERIGLINQVTRPVWQTRDRNQAGIDALALSCSLIVKDEEFF